MSHDDVEKPEDYIFRSVPKSSKQVTSQVAESRVTATVKSAVQDYLDKYFGAEGCYRSQLKLMAPYSVQYETGVVGSSDPTDPTIYNLQIARLWGQLRTKLPCIIIVDTGLKYAQSGLGGIIRSQKVDSKTSSVSTQVTCTVSLSLRIAANDEVTCSDLRDLLLYILGHLTIINKNHIIRSRRPQDRWEVRLPLDFNPQGLTRTFYNEDAKEAFWSSGVDLDVEFESTIDYTFPNQTQLFTVSPYYEGVIPDGIRNPDGSMSSLSDVAFTPEGILVPATVRLGNPTPISLNWIPAMASLLSDNPKIAIVNSSYVIIPKKLGTFNILLVDNVNIRGTKVTKRWEVKVTHN